MSSVGHEQPLAPSAEFGQHGVTPRRAVGGVGIALPLSTLLSDPLAPLSALSPEHDGQTSQEGSGHESQALQVSHEGQLAGSGQLCADVPHRMTVC